MGIRSNRGGQVDCYGSQSLAKLRTCAGVNHLPFEPNIERNLFELLAVPMGAVINSMDEFMGERIEDFDGVSVHGANEDLVDAVLG